LAAVEAVLEVLALLVVQAVVVQEDQQVNTVV
jgi:hypothetical protein